MDPHLKCGSENTKARKENYKFDQLLNTLVVSWSLVICYVVEWKGFCSLIKGAFKSSLSTFTKTWKKALNAFSPNLYFLCLSVFKMLQLIGNSDKIQGEKSLFKVKSKFYTRILRTEGCRKLKLSKASLQSCENFLRKKS